MDFHEDFFTFVPQKKSYTTTRVIKIPMEMLKTLMKASSNMCLGAGRFENTALGPAAM